MTAFLLAATIVVQFPAPKFAAPSSRSLHNVKQIGLATLMYLQDNKEVLPSAANFRTAVSRYLKDPAAFTVPGAPEGTVGYFLDPRLSGKNVLKLPDLANTAMILQGDHGRQAFPYDGRTVVGYIDGHARLVNAKAAIKARAVPLK